MASLQLPAPPTSPAVRPWPRTRVSVKREWAGAWEVVPYLEAVACADVAAPGMPWATFRWAAGSVKWEDERDFRERRPLDYKDYFVRVEVLAAGAGTKDATLWVGRICDEALAAHGTDGSGGAVPTGDQDLAAFGLAHELDRNAVLDSVCTEDGSTGFRVDAAITFNGGERRGAEEFGNRSAEQVRVPVRPGQAGEEAAGGDGTPTRDTYAFSDARDGDGKPYAWAARDVVRYVLNTQGPASTRFRAGGQLDALQGLVVPPTPVFGRTAFEVLNDVIDRRRGLGWRVVTHEDSADGNDPEVRIFTLTGEALAANGVTLPAAAEQTDLYVENYRREIAEHRLSFDTLARYGKITVVGEPVLACFTVSYPDETLTNGWTEAEKTQYLAGAGGDDAEANDDARRPESLRHVFTRFLIPRNWNWKTGDGHNANGLVIDATGGFDLGVGNPPPIRKWGRRVERWLPLRKPAGLAGSEPEYREPFALIEDTDADPPRFLAVDVTADGMKTADVRPLDRDFGVEVRFNPAHYLAKHIWGTVAKSSAVEPRLRYDKMLATVAARTDERLAVTVDVDGGVGVDRTKVIDVPGAELWWIVEGTVTDVDNAGKLVRYAGADLVLRDDAPRLRQVAALAQAWYGKPRASLRVKFREMRREFAVGAFVRQVADASGADPVNSTVTRVTWDLAAMTTTIETQYGELDFAGGERDT